MNNGDRFCHLQVYKIKKKYEITILKSNKKVTKQIGLGVSSKTVFLLDKSLSKQINDPIHKGFS